MRGRKWALFGALLLIYKSSCALHSDIYIGSCSCTALLQSSGASPQASSATQTTQARHFTFHSIICTCDAKHLQKIRPPRLHQRELRYQATPMTHLVMSDDTSVSVLPRVTSASHARLSLRGVPKEPSRPRDPCTPARPKHAQLAHPQSSFRPCDPTLTPTGSPPCVATGSIPVGL